MMKWIRMLMWLPLWLAMSLVGCGGGGGDDDEGTTGPTITTQPASQTVTEGATATFSVVASGQGTLTYQWRRGGTVISGATSSSYTTAATAASDHGASFTVVVTDSNGSTTSSAATLSVTALPRGTLTGTVTATDGSALAGATVTAGSASGTTGTDGSYSFAVVATDRVMVSFSATGHTAMHRAAAVTATASTTLNAQLLPVATSQALNVATGGTVSDPGSTAQVVLPAGGLVREDGGAVASSVTVQLTPIDPAVDVSRMPGDYTTMVSGSAAPIESFGAIAVDIHDSSGARYNLASGQTSTIRIPLSTRTPSGSIPGTIPLFYFNESTGRWVQEGTATLQGTAPNQYYEGTVTHFSYWNADQVLETVYLNGCVQDAAGQPVADAFVSTDGINYTGTSSTRSGTDGTFRVAVKSQSQLAITALSGNRLTNTLSVTSGSTGSTLESCLVLSDAAASLNIRLTWGQLPEDVDSHVFLPSGEHISYRAKGSLLSPTFAYLDVDDTDGYGPEVVTVSKLMVGTYRYFLHNFDGTFNPGMTASPVRVELNLGNSQRVFAPGTGEGTSNYYWHAFDLVVASDCTVTVQSAGTWSASQPAQPANASTVTYCSAP